MKFIRVLKADYNTPIYVGNLEYEGKDTNEDLGIIYFAIELNGSDEGEAFAVLRGPILTPVLNEQGERIIQPGMAGLSCDYNKEKGTLENFRKD